VKAAPLTGALLAVKGDAAPTPRSAASRGGSVEFLPRRARTEAPAGAETARVTLRLPMARRLRLRLAAAHLGRSNQALMLAAIDHYIDNVLPLLMAGRCACLEQGRAVDGGCAALGFGRAHPDHRP
jgi:predicted DNA-binding protein